MLGFHQQQRVFNFDIVKLFNNRLYHCFTSSFHPQVWLVLHIVWRHTASYRTLLFSFGNLLSKMEKGQRLSSTAACTVNSIVPRLVFRCLVTLIHFIKVKSPLCHWNPVCIDLGLSHASPAHSLQLKIQHSQWRVLTKYINKYMHEGACCTVFSQSLLFHLAPERSLEWLH